MTLPDAVETKQPDSPPNSRRRDEGAAPPPRIVLGGGPWSWLLRTTAVSTFAAAVAGVMVAPGLRGLAPDRIVVRTNQLGWTLAYFAVGLLVSAIVAAVIELSRGARSRSAVTGAAVAAGGLVAALAVPAMLRPLPPQLAVGLAVVASSVAALGGVRGLRAQHTRAVGLLMLSMAVAGLARVVAWDLARRAGDSGNTGLYAASRVVATAALGFEGFGQMLAAAWLGTRSRVLGQLLSSVAVGLAWLLTYAAAVGASVDARPWQAAAHIGLATATSLPQPYGPPGLAVFLLAASILLAGVAAVQRGQVVAVVTALALSLIGRGAFDVPVHALAAAAAGLWLILAGSDERAIWQSLLATRDRLGPRAAASTRRAESVAPSGRTP